MCAAFKGGGITRFVAVVYGDLPDVDNLLGFCSGE